MLQKLKKKIKELGVNRVTSELGYRSQTTIYTWIKNKKIPDAAKAKVKEYLVKVK